MKYVCIYDVDDSQKRKYVLSAKNKIDYILSAIEKNTNEEIEIISVAETTDTHMKTGRREYISPHISLKLFFSFGCRSKLTKMLDRVILPVRLLLYMLLHAKKGEDVIVYHSLRFCTPVAVAKRIKKFKIILELEEIYSDVSGKKNQRKRELRFSSIAESYIFSTQLLDELVNINHKPSVVIYGTYQVEGKCNTVNRKLQHSENESIHCVYAGTLDPRKGGAVAAAAAEFLPENYHIHILGFGSDSEIQNMKDAIADIASRSKAKVSYDGLLSGEEYIRFIQSCDIGLSTQNPDAAFNATSFPSKILSYMANGLRVVSIQIPAIEKSAVGRYMHYYQNQMPEEIANAIMTVKLDDEYDGRRIISELDTNFCREIRTLLR